MEESRPQNLGLKECTQPGAGRHCPFILSPFDDCFVVGLNSQNIKLAIYYCGGNFEECEVYRRETGKQLLKEIA
ncbi:MAG: hypothetical protein NDI77_17295 [Geobacteraceae bacterium]|nr:hypothetical protein [Geobacteraceae bacterium]